MKTYFFSECGSLEEVKKKYKELAMKHHPDKGGDTATMQQINAEYAAIIKNPHFECKPQTEAETADSLKYPEIINQVIFMEGLIIEIIGNWLWLSGNTYPYRVQLKQIGFYFAPKKTMWYYRPSDYKSANHKPIDIDEIRAKYGSTQIGSEKRAHVLN